MEPKKVKHETVYALTQNSKKSGDDFARASKWASLLYGSLKAHERSFASRTVFQRLVKILVNIYKSDEKHLLGEKRLFAGRVSLLNDWKINNYGQWPSEIVRPELNVATNTGEVILRLPAAVFPSHRFNHPRAKMMNLRFYIYLIDEDHGQLQMQATENLSFNLDETQGAIATSCYFQPIKNGMLAILGIAQVGVASTDQHTISPSGDKRLFKANIIKTTAIADGKCVNYGAKSRLLEPELRYQKSAWSREETE